MVKIKICGITNFEDALNAAGLGADYAGFIFSKKSVRNISIKNASEIIKKLPVSVKTVGVFVDENVENIIKTIKKCSLNLIQLHGNESLEYCKNLKDELAKSNLNSVGLIKAIKIKNRDIIESIENYKGKIDFLLLDTFVEGAEGGTGATFDWDIAVEVKKSGMDFFLAGGLTPENVKQAVEKIQPYGVDTSSGVERLPRRKDFDKLKRFITCLK
ncbi:MAG: phosphoribosylanthranilate isomerase [Elusimicrobiota bacterium]